jgi:hypothetical protein
MRQVIIAFAAMTCLLLVYADCSQGQLPQPAQPQPGVSIGFRNRSEYNVLVKGYTIVNGMQKPGQILQMKKSGGMAFEANVPVGVRYFTIYNANQPAIILMQNFPVSIQNRDVFFEIVPSPANPKLLILVPATMP